MLNGSSVFGSNNLIKDDKETLFKKLNVSKSMLATISLSSSSNGMLCKWDYTGADGVKYFVKSGSLNNLGFFSEYEPMSEVMAYRLGKLLGFSNLVKTYYDRFHFEETDLYNEQTALLSYTKDFTSDNEYFNSMLSYVSEREINLDGKGLYNLILNRFPFIEGDLVSMFVFDFIVVNTDRHLRNFGLIELDNVPVKCCPIFDNGLSLLSEFTDVDLDMPLFNLDKSIKCKPFNSKHYSQIKLFDLAILDNSLKNNLLTVNVDWDYVFSDFNLSDLRKRAIKFIVERRLSYVRSLLS